MKVVIRDAGTEHIDSVPAFRITHFPLSSFSFHPARRTSVRMEYSATASRS